MPWALERAIWPLTLCVYGNLRIAYRAAIPDRSRWAEKEVQECLIVLMAEPRSLSL